MISTRDLAVCALAVALAGCGGSGSSATHTDATEVYGRVTAGPTCPVERVGVPCPERPVVGEIEARRGNGRPVTRTRLGADGRYVLRVAAGRYELVVVTSSPFPRCPPTDVVVERGASLSTDIMCDTGIR